MSETKAAFPLRSLKKIFYRYMEHYGDNKYHNFSQLVTTPTCWTSCSIDLVPKNVMISDVLSILYSKSLRRKKKPNFETGNKFRIYKYQCSFRKITSDKLDKKIKTVATASRKSTTYTKYDEQDVIIRSKFHQKETLRVNQEKIRLQ